eukprot:Lankesteria_metandrocarpae@DN6217_c0_g1_i1.p1
MYDNTSAMYDNTTGMSGRQFSSSKRSSISEGEIVNSTRANTPISSTCSSPPRHSTPPQTSDRATTPYHYTRNAKRKCEAYTGTTRHSCGTGSKTVADFQNSSDGTTNGSYSTGSSTGVRG